MAIEIDLQDFIDEAEDQIRVLNDGLLALEKDKTNEEIINEVFRAAHTLKGGSGLVGFVKLTELTHHLESIFDLIRDKKLSLASSHLDVMFEVLDVIMELMGEVDSGQFTTNIEPVSKKLKAILDAQAASKEDAKATAAPKEEKAETPAKDKVAHVKPSDSLVSFLGRAVTEEESELLDQVFEEGDPIYQVYIRISDVCDVVSLFMFMIFNKIKELGELVISIPSADDLEDDELKEVRILFTSIVSPDEIKKELQMPEVDEITVEPLLDMRADKDEIPDISPIEEAPTAGTAGFEAPEDQPETSLVAKEDSSGRKGGATTLRVDSTKIDSLLNLAGELVINKARFVQIESDLEKIIGKSVKIAELKEAVMNLMRITNELQEGIMQLRMVAIDQVFSRFPRVVRDLARKLDKNINLVVEGKDTELDKSVVEEIGDPLMHLVRNSVDHGIETKAERKAKGKRDMGTIMLRAYHQGSSIVLEIQDDGKGIDIAAIKAKSIEKGIVTEAEATAMSDKDAVNLIFSPGFSTAKIVSDLSGRGVGLDVVKRNVERLNGIVEIVSEKDKGSTFTIKLPLTLAIISTLLIRVAKSTYAIPLVNVIEIVEVAKKDIAHIAKKEAIKIRNEVINILRLGEVLSVGTPNRDQETVQVVIVGVASQRVGFVVDDLIGEQDVVIKSLDNELVECPGIAGASILGDGSIALIVDVSTLVEKVVAGIY